jgi:2,5-diamino-6-(ribosylamino)-4(3H)-pyrimidinone 5'-phosphate reductase
MTHRLRVMHQAILVGSGTACIDDPQLNGNWNAGGKNAHYYSPDLFDVARHVPLEDFVHQPQPIVVDTHLDLPLTCKLLKNYKLEQGKQPWVLTSSKDSTKKVSVTKGTGLVDSDRYFV